MCAVVRRDLGFEPFRVARIARAALSAMLLRVRFPPALHPARAFSELRFIHSRP